MSWHCFLERLDCSIPRISSNDLVQDKGDYQRAAWKPKQGCAASDSERCMGEHWWEGSWQVVNLAQHISWLSQAVIKAQWVFFLKVLFSRISSPTCSRLVLSNLLGNTCQTKGLVLPSKSIFTGQHFFGTTENASTQPNPQAHDFFVPRKNNREIAFTHDTPILKQCLTFLTAILNLLWVNFSEDYLSTSKDTGKFSIILFKFLSLFRPAATFWQKGHNQLPKLSIRKKLVLKMLFCTIIVMIMSNLILYALLCSQLRRSTDIFLLPFQFKR